MYTIIKEMEKKENKINLQRYAMHAGTLMGLYWIIKFPLLPLGFTYPIASLLFFALTLAVPIIGYYYTRSFRDNVCDGEISFAQSWVFMVFMFLFASLLVAVVHYIYFRFIDNGFIADTWITLLKENKQMMNELFAEDPLIIIERVRSLTSIELTMQLLSCNMINCSIISLIIAPFVMKKKKIKSTKL